MTHLEEAMKTGGMTEVGVAMDETGTTSPHLMDWEGGTNMGEETGGTMIAMVMTDGNTIGMKIMVQDGVEEAIHLREVGGAIHLREVGGAIHLHEVGEVIRLLVVGGDMNLIEVGGTILRGMGMAERRDRGLEVRRRAMQYSNKFVEAVNRRSFQSNICSNCSK